MVHDLISRRTFGPMAAMALATPAQMDQRQPTAFFRISDGMGMLEVPPPL